MRLLGRTWWPLLGALLVAEFAVFAAVTAAGLALYVLRGAPDFWNGGGRFMDPLVILFLPTLLGCFLCQGAVASLASTLALQGATGAPVTVRGILRASVPQLPGSVGGSVLAVFLYPFVLSPLAPLLLWPWVLYSIAPSVRTREGLGMAQAMSRAAQLVRGVWWPVVARLALAALVAFGLDAAGGFLLVNWFMSEDGERFASSLDGVVGGIEFMAVLVGVLTVLIIFLMVQAVFTYLVSDRLCAALISRRPSPRPTPGYGPGRPPY
ncbi:hypothetical protein ACIBEA_04495 [Streptomyces sp. NPDC051555]|uniref:hypothetical protein n=1 Tax=Streptomyces sp. NPDC051555 TaxID=3365657 RepID=UPI0037B46B3A